VKVEAVNGTDVRYFKDVAEIKRRMRQVLEELKEDIKCGFVSFSVFFYFRTIFLIYL
jgi:hypothetical protein